MSTIANLTVALNADVGGFTGTMASATRSINQFKKMGQTVFEATRTPLEQYQTSLKRLQALYHGGQLSADTFGRAVRKLNDEFRASQSSGVGGQLAGGLLGFSTGVGATIVAANAAVHAVEGLGRAMVGLGVTAVKLAADFETTEITLTTLFKSAAVAKEVMGQLKQFSAETPFEFPEIKDAASKLAGFGVTAQQVVPTLKMLGDIAAATGTNVGELAETYGKARITGRAYTRDVMELANRNVPIWQALNKVLGTTSSETHKMVEDGKVGFAELQKAMLSLVDTGGQFEGAMEDRAKGIEGLFSNLKDNVTISLADLGEVMIRELNLKDVTAQLIDLTGVFRTDGVPVIIEFSKGMMLVAEATNDVLTVTTGLDFSIKGITETIYGARASMLQWNLAVAQLIGSEEQVIELQKQIVELGLRATGLGPKPQAPGLPEIEPGGNETGIDKEIAALERQAEMVGKTARQKKLAELMTKGLLEADMEYVAALIEQTEQQSLARAAEEQTRKTMESHIAALKQQADTYGMNARNIDLYRARLAKANAEEINAINAQHDRLDQQKRMQREFDDLDKQHKEAQNEIGRITERNLTPQEKHDRDMKRLEALRSHGLNDEQFGRESARLKQELEDATRPTGGHRNTSTPALQAGTSGFYSAIARSVNANPKNAEARDRKQLLANAKQELIVARQQLAELKKRKVAFF